MVGREIRHGWALIRQLAAEKTAVFCVCVEIEKTEAEGEGRYISTILPLETVIAAGPTPTEAEQNALGLFQEMVDHCVDAGTLQEFIGDSGIMETVDIGMSKLMDAVETLKRKVRQHSGQPLPRFPESHSAGERPSIPPWFVKRDYDDAGSCVHD
jgi:predicted RNase H-like HicB family nuclease